MIQFCRKKKTLIKMSLFRAFRNIIDPKENLVSASEKKSKKMKATRFYDLEIFF